MLTILCCTVIGTTSFWNPDRQLPDADALQEICPGFTETAMDHERGTSVIRIAHFFVQEYLESDRILLQEGSASFSIRKPCGNLMLASMCLTLLLDSRFRRLELREIYQQHPFAIYAARHWPNHWQKSKETDATLALCGDFSHCHPKVSHGKLILRLQDQMMLLFRDSNGAMRIWYEIVEPYWTKEFDLAKYGMRGEMEIVASPLYYASHLGARFLVEGLCETWRGRCNLREPTETCIHHMKGRSGPHGTPIQAAAALGHRDVVEFFLDKRANPNKMKNFAQRDAAYGNSLITASAHGQTEIMELLLKRGAEINVIVGLEVQFDLEA
ncbi:hypothetical protein CSAL01_03546, partial [Colletotrichum salicis]